MIHHQNADAMVLASARLRGIPPPLDVHHFEYYQGGECLSNAHWLGPWRQHLMTNYGLRQNHRKIIGKRKKSAFCVPYYGGPQVQCTKQYPTTQNKIPLHKTKFTIHKTQFHNTKPNFATQNKIPLHETKFHYTKLDSTTQNSIHDTQNKIPLRKTQFTTHKTQFHYTKLYSTTQNSIHDAQLSRKSAGKWHDQPV